MHARTLGAFYKPIALRGKTDLTPRILVRSQTLYMWRILGVHVGMCSNVLRIVPLQNGDALPESFGSRNLGLDSLDKPSCSAMLWRGRLVGLYAAVFVIGIVDVWGFLTGWYFDVPQYWCWCWVE